LQNDHNSFWAGTCRVAELPMGSPLGGRENEMRALSSVTSSLRHPASRNRQTDRQTYR